MDRPPPRATVALISPNDATRLGLQASLEDAGFSTVSPDSRHLRHGQLDLAGFLEDRGPAIVIYDLVPPYSESWRLLQAVASTEAAKGHDFILTTANRAALERELGPTEAIEIGDRPFEHHALVTTVRRALEARAQGTQPQ